MNKKSKRLLIFSLLLFFSIVVAALGLRYFPFTRMIRMPAGAEKEFINPKTVKILSPHQLFYDFEVAPGKEMPGGLYKGIAHSGQYSVKAFGQNSFSIAVERTAKEIGVENLKAVSLSAWIYVFPTSHDVKGTLVFTASNELGVNVCWQGVGVHEPLVPKGKWFKISGYFDLASVAFKPGYKLQVYFWNNSSTDILVDDYNIVFGGTPERRGDSARVDMTRPAGYIPRFNYPPFPVSLLEKETGLSLPKPSDIGTADQVIAGNFFNSGSDGLFIIKPDGRPAAFAFCAANKAFRKVVLNNAAALSAISPVKKLITGRFVGGLGEQVVIAGDRGWILAAIDASANICSSSGDLQATLKILCKSDGPSTSITAGDFNGDHRAEVLEIAANGSWKVLSFEQAANKPGNWKVIAENAKEPVKLWDQGNQELSVSAGKFLSHSVGDQVLTIAKAKTDGKYSWTILKLNIPAMRWEPAFTEKQGYCGKTIGLDTLKPDDILISGIDGDGNQANVIRYNRDWRFDLREIRFNDSTFTILQSYDFHGFEQDHNPKYYESLALIPGHYSGPPGISFLTVGHIARERHYESILPDFVALYSMSKKK